MPPHYPGVGRGLAGSLFTLAWNTAQLLIRDHIPRMSGLAPGKVMEKLRMVGEDANYLRVAGRYYEPLIESGHQEGDVLRLV